MRNWKVEFLVMHNGHRLFIFKKVKCFHWLASNHWSVGRLTHVFKQFSFYLVPLIFCIDTEASSCGICMSEHTKERKKEMQVADVSSLGFAFQRDVAWFCGRKHRNGIRFAFLEAGIGVPVY